MSKTEFANAILSKVRATIGSDGGKYTSASPTAAQSAIAEAITEYLIAHTTVKVSYSGVFSGGVADVVPTSDMKISGTCAPTNKPSTFAEWVQQIQDRIAAAFTVVSPSTQAVTTSFKPFNPVTGSLSIPQSTLLSAHNGNTKSPALAVWEALCGCIMDWINSANGKNPSATGVAATRPSSSGTATLLSITID